MKKKILSFESIFFIPFIFLFSLSAYAELGTLQHEADTLARKGKVSSAIDAYEELLHKYPHSSDIYYNLGTLELQQQQTGKAVWYLLSAISLDTANHDAHAQLQQVFEARNSQGLEKLSLPVVYRVKEYLSSMFSLILIMLLASAAFIIFILELIKGRNFSLLFYTHIGLLALVAVAFYQVEEFSFDQLWVLQEDTGARKYPQQDAEVLLTAEQGLFGFETRSAEGFKCIRMSEGAELCFEESRLKQVM